MDNIIVKGARQHNLKNVSLTIPKNKLVVFTGLSGSGKSSLAFDTIYAEGQRRYVESLSSYARQFLGVMSKPDVDTIEGLSPAISIDQKTTSQNPRSTVGTVTEIYDYIRLLFARIGHPHCPNCGREISRQSPQQIVTQIEAQMHTVLQESKGKYLRFLILSPIVRDRKGEFSGLLENVSAKGYRQVRVDGAIFNLGEQLVLIKTNKHSIEVVIDRFSLDKKLLRDTVAHAGFRSRLAQAVEQALTLSDGLVVAATVLDASLDFPERPKKFADHLFSERFSCPECNMSMPAIEPRNFSFNSPHGACSVCHGIGTILTVDPELVFNQNLSITEGGILPFAKMFVNDTWFARLVKTVAEKHSISLTERLSSLTEKQKDVLLMGTKDRVYEVVGQNRFGRMTSIHEPFHGLIAELKRRHLETESEFLRKEIQKYMRQEVCLNCNGARLKKESLGVTIATQSITDTTRSSIVDAFSWFSTLAKDLSDREQEISRLILKEIISRLSFLKSVGLEYLTLDRSAGTLSGGEAQRIRLTSQIGSGLSGVIYVLDEPSIGLHARDNTRLIQTLKRLRDLGNTIVVVEHDKEIMKQSDYIFDFGPGAGKHGGTIVAKGTPKYLQKSKRSITGPYLSGKKKIALTRPQNLTANSKPTLLLRGCSQYNLKNITVSFPLGKLVCITGVSGSGKSTLIVETLYHALARYVNPLHRVKPGAFAEIVGLEHIDKVVLIDQSPIGRTPRSNPATYTGAFTHIRQLFSKLQQAKVRGFDPGRFSFNVKGGRCEACQGDGQIKIEMQFLADVYVLCEICHGSRYKNETLEITYKGKNIAEVLKMTVEEALMFFHQIPGLREKLQTLNNVGLSYMELGQSAPTLSGGEAQRVKLASELSKRQTGKTVFILDEPTTGLHFADLEKLLSVLQQLVAHGNTIIVIEHNLDVIKNADHIIDLGPEGGLEGGEVVATGSPEHVCTVKKSYTGQFLKKIL